MGSTPVGRTIRLYSEFSDIIKYGARVVGEEE